MRDERIVFFDLETGGLDPLRHPIIQFAAVAVDAEWTELEALELKLVFDPTTADAGALAVNHYDAEVWKKEATGQLAALEAVSDLFRRNATVQKMSKQRRPYSVARLGAHNAPFDCGFLVQWFKSVGMFCPAACYEPLDTLSLARWASLGAEPAPENHKLESLCRWLGIDLGGAHDALEDVRATVAVARVLTERLGIGWGRAAAPMPLDAAWQQIRALHSDPEGCRTFDQYASGIYDALRVLADLGAGQPEERTDSVPEAPPSAQVIDLMEALKASLKEREPRG